MKQITSDFKERVNRKKPFFYDSCIVKEIKVEICYNGSNEKAGYYICFACKENMLIGKIPAMAAVNGLMLAPIKQDCILTEFENNLIALNINFQYIFCLRKSRWAATKKQMITIPIDQQDVLNTTDQLPRLPADACLIPVGLKRKKGYKHCHKKEYIDSNKIFKALDFIKKAGHPYYQFYENFLSYKKRCKSQDPNGHDFIFGEEDSEDTNSSQSDNEFDDDDNHNYLTKDTIRKYQFDHNRNTCMTNNYPEATVDENG